MLYETFLTLLEKLLERPAIKRQVWKRWYDYLTKWFDVNTLRFMNCGYAEAGMGSLYPALEASDEADRLSIQLYHRVAGGIKLEGLRVLEVGSGRGGGCLYLKKYLHAGSVVGLERSGRAVLLCRQAHAWPGVTFTQGDAEALPFDNGVFDVLLNVESSHCYGSMTRFLGEVRRVLKPGGHFLFADFRPAVEISALRRQLEQSGLEIVEDRDITENVLTALDLDSPRRLALIAQHTPRFLYKLLAEFAAVKDSHAYVRFSNRSLVYKSYVLEHAESDQTMERPVDIAPGEKPVGRSLTDDDLRPHTRPGQAVLSS